MSFLPSAPASTWLLPFSAAVYRLAFGATGEPLKRTHEWGVPPDPWAVDALAARAAGHVWRPKEPPPQPAYTYRAAVRRLLRSEEAKQPGYGNPVLQLEYARHVVEQHAQCRDNILRAEDYLTAAVRDGKVPAFGVLVDAPNAAQASGPEVPTPPEELMPSGRIIRLNNVLCWRTDDYQDFGPSGCGPYYVNVRVDSAAVRRLLAPGPMPAISHASVWRAITWRAFGSAGGFHNLGSRPENLWDPRLARFENWDEHALQLGAWAALIAAETELKALALSKQITIYGRQEGLKLDGYPSFKPAGRHVPIPPELFLNSRWIFEPGGWLRERSCNEVTVIDGRPTPRELWFYEVEVSLPELAAAWDADILSGATTAYNVAEQTPQPFPDAPTVSPWLAASWRAFRTYSTPLHIVRHRSFDGGTQRLPNEPNATYEARLDDHRRFDAAERELMDLLAAGCTKVTGQLPARAASGDRLHDVVPGHMHIQASMFLDQQLAFAPSGELTRRLPTLVRIAPPHELLGSDADPRFPLYHNVLIEAAGLRKAWDAEANVSNRPSEILGWMIDAAETFLREKNAKPKRDSIVKDCVRALGCRYEDAEAAHRKLPDHLRRQRGETARKVKSAG